MRIKALLAERDAYFYCAGSLVASACVRNWAGCIMAVCLYGFILLIDFLKRKNANNKRNI